MKKLLCKFLAVMFGILLLSACSYGSQIDGIWETNFNGTHFVAAYAEDEYYCWLDNQLVETGIFSILGDTIIGLADNGTQFENTFQLSDDLSHLLIVREDGLSFMFSRMQNNARPPAAIRRPRRPQSPSRRKCGICHGSGRCTMCFGKGQTYVAGYGGVGSGSYVTCSACSGTGKCWRCEGTGR